MRVFNTKTRKSNILVIFDLIKYQLLTIFSGLTNLPKKAHFMIWIQTHKLYNPHMYLKVQTSLNGTFNLAISQFFTKDKLMELSI